MWSRAILILGLASMAGTPVFGAQPGELPGEVKPLAALGLAQKLYAAGQYRSAETILRANVDSKHGGAEPAVTTGCLNLLTTIYYESGRYGQALETGRRYQKILDQLKDLDPEIVARRQEIAVTLANVHTAMGEHGEAMKMLSRALSLPGGNRMKDPLWQARMQAMQARLAQEQEPEDTKRAQSIWRLVEPQARAVVAQAPRGMTDSARQVAARQLLLEALLATDPPQSLETFERLLSRQTDKLAKSRIWADIATCHAKINANNPDDPREKQSLMAACKLQSQDEKQKFTAEYADLLDRLGLLCQRQGDDVEAQLRWTEAAEIYDRLSKQGNSDEAGIAQQMQAYQNLQRIYQRLENWREGIRVTKILLTYRERTKVPDDPSIYREKSVLGVFSIKNGDSALAEPLLQEALDYWRTRTPPSLTELAGTLNNLAEVTRSNGSYTDALKYLEEALPIYQRIYPADDFRVAELHSNLASAQAGKGQYTAAIDHYDQAAAICRRLQGSEGRRADKVLATTLLNTAILYKSQRQFEKAAGKCQEALDIRLRGGTPADDLTLRPFYLALATLHLAKDRPRGSNPSASDDDLQQAVRYTELARAICQKNGLMNTPDAATIAQLEGTIHLREKNADLAKEDWGRALMIARKTHHRVSEVKSLNYLATAELSGLSKDKLRKPDNVEAMKAADQLDKLSAEALKLAASVQAFPNLQFVAYLNRAQFLDLGKRPSEAREMLDNAIKQIEAPRAATVGAESERAEFFSQFVVAFDLLVDWNVEDGKYEAALRGAERGRNRTFRDQVRAAGVDFRDSLKGTPKEDLLRQEQEMLEAYRQQMKRVQEASADEFQTEADKLEDRRLEYATIETEIRGASPAYSNLLGEKEADSWANIAPKVLKPDNLLLLYYLGHKRSHLFIVDGRTHEIQHYPLKISSDAVEKLSDTLRSPIESGPLTRDVAAQLVNANLAFLRNKNPSNRSRGLATNTVQSEKGRIQRESAQVDALERPEQRIALTEILLPKETRDRIKELNPEHVVVVPDGALHQLPLEALQLDEEPARYVFDDLPPMTCAPSATIMSILSERQQDQASRPVSLLTVGDPKYPEEDKSIASRAQEITTSADYLTMGGQLSRLPFTAEECKSVRLAIEATGPSSDIKSLREAEATENNVRAYLGGRRFLHLATHGLVDQQYENLFGAIALTPPPTVVSPEDDGFLSLYEIHNLKLNECELVVLSACETNVGPDRPLEAGSTLARAFLSAGAARVVCSQWSVDDASTAVLIGEFFARFSEALKQGRPPNFARALYDARRKVRKDPNWAAPYHWAPFVLIGPAR